MIDEYSFLASEVVELEKILSAIPAKNVIDRLSFEARLTAVKAELEQLPHKEPRKMLLTFHGKPVYGTYGIAAEFGSKAANFFADAFVAIAASLGERLQNTGPIPNREKSQLLITGVAVGSFGFEFELPASEPTLFSEKGEAQEAMSKMENLFRLTVAGTDDEVAEVVEDVHPRAVRKVYDFLDLMVQHEAWCGIEFDQCKFRYDNHLQMKASCERLKNDNIQEREESFTGEFLGVLPTGRHFEFCCDDQRAVIRGKLAKTIAEPQTLSREWLFRPVTVKFRVIQVGQGRPRYTLESLNDVIEKIK